MITPRKKAIGRSLVVLGLAFARPAAAQVNVEPMRAKLEDDGLGGSVDARFAGPLAEHAKVQAERIAGAMLRRLTGAHR